MVAIYFVFIRVNLCPCALGNSLHHRWYLRLIKALLASSINGALQNAPADVDETFTEARFEKRFRQERQAGKNKIGVNQR